MTPEECFFRFAFPCSEVLYTVGKIDKKTFSLLQDFAEKKQAPPRELLEQTFRSAIRKIRERMNIEDIWNLDTIKKYFLKVHNEALDDCDIDHLTRDELNKHGLLEQILKLCRIHEAAVIGIISKPSLPHKVLKVKFNSTERNIVNLYDLNVAEGDRVIVHYGIAVEKIKL